MLVGEALVEGSQFHQRPWWSKTGVSQAACPAEFWKAPATVGESSSDCLSNKAACTARYHYRPVHRQHFWRRVRSVTKRVVRH